jgi:chromate transporter
MSSSQDEMPCGDSRTIRLGQLAALFLRLGATAFGGPAAHIAMMEDECVRRRNWLPNRYFLGAGLAGLTMGVSSSLPHSAQLL